MSKDMGNEVMTAADLDRLLEEFKASLARKNTHGWTMLASPRELITMDKMTFDWDDDRLIAFMASAMFPHAPPPSAILANTPIGEPIWCYWRKDNDHG